MNTQEVYKIKLSGTDRYMGYSKEDFSQDTKKHKLYVSADQAIKVHGQLTEKGFDVEIESFELRNRKTVLADLLRSL